MNIPKIIPSKEKKGTQKKLNTILDRIERNSACGIIFNVPEVYSSAIISRLSAEDKIIAIDGKAYSRNEKVLAYLGKHFKIKNFRIEYLPSRIERRILAIYHADYVESNFGRLLEDCNKLNIPILLLLKSQHAVNSIRNFSAYHRIFTVEQDYSEFLSINN